MSSDKHQDTSPLTALIGKFHACNREVGIEARFRASLNGEVPIDADAGVLRQDRYPLRTAPQYLGPQLETVQKSAETIAIECNSSKLLIDQSSKTLF